MPQKLLHHAEGTEGLAGQASSCPSWNCAKAHMFVCMQVVIWSSSTQRCPQPQLGLQRLTSRLCSGLPSTLIVCMRSGKGHWPKEQPFCMHEQADVYVMSAASSLGVCCTLLHYSCRSRSLKVPALLNGILWLTHDRPLVSQSASTVLLHGLGPDLFRSAAPWKALPEEGEPLKAQ